MGRLVLQVFGLVTRVFKDYGWRYTNGSSVGSEVTLPVRALSRHVVCSSAVQALAALHAILTLRL